MNFENVLNPNFIKMMPLEFIVSMITMLIIIVLSFVIYFKQKKYGPLDKPKGIVNVAETVIGWADEKVNGLMHCPRWFGDFAGYIIPLFMFIFIGFFIGMMGIPNFIVLGSAEDGYIINESKLFVQLPNPFTNLAFTLSLGLLTVIMIEVTKLRVQKFSYWKQFVFTFPPFVPLVTNLSPMISLGVRLFGNSFAGYCIMTLLYNALANIGGGFGLIASPFVMPFMHAYFDAFSGFIQSLVFVMITMMDIAQEAPSEESQKEMAMATTLKASL
jgi:F-type H+-transporting ATPase subunit a